MRNWEKRSPLLAARTARGDAGNKNAATTRTTRIVFIMRFAGVETLAGFAYCTEAAECNVAVPLSIRDPLRAIEDPLADAEVSIIRSGRIHDPESDCVRHRPAEKLDVPVIEDAVVARRVATSATEAGGGH